MKMNSRVITLTGIVLLLLTSVQCQQCTRDDVSNTPPCVCTLNGKNIDLRSLATNDNTVAFKIDKASDQNAYSYNPCTSFTDGDCKSVAGCQDAGGNKRSTGTQDTAKFTTDDKGVTSITYSGGSENREMVVTLMCKEGQTTPSFAFVGELTSLEYTFTLTTVCACPGGCDEHGPISGGGGGGKSSSGGTDKAGIPGIVILSVFFLAIIVYFVAGMIIMRVKYEKTGSDIIPNKGFWTDLPFLVKDGVVLTFTPCIRCYRNRTKGYSKF